MQTVQTPSQLFLRTSISPDRQPQLNINLRRIFHATNTMMHHQIIARRTPRYCHACLRRPVIPPRQVQLPRQPRPFTNQPQQSFSNNPSPIRPQLPFLSQTQGRLPLALHLRQHFTRLISTSRTSRYKRGVYRGLKISVTLYAILWMLHFIKTGLYQEEIEHKWPTPQEWSWRSRWALRSAVALQHPEEVGQVKTPWQNVYEIGRAHV